VLSLGLAPALAGSPFYVIASSPVAKVSLAPFVHINESTVTELLDGIGYVDSIIYIKDGMLTLGYVNTTEYQNTSLSYHIIGYISVYGASQITIDNTSMPSTTLFVYGSSQVTLINSTFSNVTAYNSSRITLKSNSKSNITAFDDSEVNIINSTVPYLRAYNSSKIFVSGLSQIDIFRLYHRTYAEVDNSTLNDLRAYDGFVTGQITNSTLNTFGSFDAANISVIDSLISGNLGYGLVCTGGSLNIIDSTITGIENCRNTTTLINSIYPSTDLVSISAFASSSVKILNNESISLVYAHDSSSVYLENVSFSGTRINKMITCTDYSTTVVKNNQPIIRIHALCYGYSSLVLQNITFIEPSWLSIEQYDRSSTTIKNCTIVGTSWGAIYDHYLYGQSTSNISNITLTEILSSFTLNSHDSSIVNIENVNITAFTGIFFVYSWDSSVVDVVNATTYSFIPGNVFWSFDRSVMTITDSDITSLGYAVVSNGDMSVTNGELGGNYINTTTWINPKSLGQVALKSIAVVGTDELTITDSNISVYTYLHDNAKLNARNISTDTAAISVLCMYDTSTASATNTKFGQIKMFDRSSANLFNISAYNVYIWDSTTLICNGSVRMKSTIEGVHAYSNTPQQSNVIIDKCMVTQIEGITWIQKQPILSPIDIILWLIILLWLLLISILYSPWI
jgi:hypothetical protein